MQLKEYQTRALDAFTRWWNELRAAQAQSETIIATLEQVGADIPPDIRNYPKSAWKKLAEAGEVAASDGSYVDRTAAAGYSITACLLQDTDRWGQDVVGCCRTRTAEPEHRAGAMDGAQ